MSETFSSSADGNELDKDFDDIIRENSLGRGIDSVERQTAIRAHLARIGISPEQALGLAASFIDEQRANEKDRPAQ